VGEKIVVEGWGPPGLLQRVRKLNLMGIVLAGYALRDAVEKSAPTKYRFILEEVETGSKFITEGFCFPDLLNAFNETELGRELTFFAGYKLVKKPSRGMERYRATIEAV